MRQIADWGANVIKIGALTEDAGGEQPGGPRRGSGFQNLHRNKRAMTLNLKDERGLAVFKRLAAKADVVVENFRPDVKKKLGIDYESLAAINSRIVYGSISGFGQDGPYHKRPGFDQIAQGMGGLMSITARPRARNRSISRQNSSTIASVMIEPTRPFDQNTLSLPSEPIIGRRKASSVRLPSTSARVNGARGMLIFLKM